MDTKPSREELKKRLREKINGKRSNSEITQNAKKDPQTTMLSMGIDDPYLLKNAQSIIKNPYSAIKNISDILKDEEEEPPSIV
jgi:hypothetical protein